MHLPHWSFQPPFLLRAVHSGGITFICQQYLHVVEHMSWWGFTTIDVLAGGKSVLLCVDAVQFAYHTQRTGSTDFWNQLKGLERRPSAEHDTRVVMAASYGIECSAANIVLLPLPLSSIQTWW
jgi:hypothetical protein